MSGAARDFMRWRRLRAPATTWRSPSRGCLRHGDRARWGLGSRSPTRCSRATASPPSPSPRARSYPWGLPFGTALKDIAPGDYARNEKILRVLRERHPLQARARGRGEPDGTHDQGPGRVPGGFHAYHVLLPDEPNFRDAGFTAYELDPEAFRPGKPVPLHEQPGTFMGYRRPGGKRGVGTRNHVVVLGVTLGPVLTRSS